MISKVFHMPTFSNDLIDSIRSELSPMFKNSTSEIYFLDDIYELVNTDKDASVMYELRKEGVSYVEL